MKKIILILILVFLSQCGYSPVYKNNSDINFKIILQEMKGNKSINSIIRRSLDRYSTRETEKVYLIQTESAFSKSILAKDKTGKATDIKLQVDINFIVKTKKGIEYFKFKESLNIENNLNSYEQSNYEDIIKNNFINSIMEEFIVKLRLIK